MTNLKHRSEHRVVGGGGRIVAGNLVQTAKDIKQIATEHMSNGKRPVSLIVGTQGEVKVESDFNESAVSGKKMSFFQGTQPMSK